MGAKAYLIQLYGFCVKVFLQRWRTPVVTLVEILLPFFFALLLSICYWTTDRTTMPARMFDGTVNQMMNYTQLGSYFFCASNTTTIRSSLRRCRVPEARLTCLAKMDNEVCYPSQMRPALSGMAFGLYFMNGPFAIFNLDYYLMWSAYLTEEYETMNPTFLGRSSRASLSHFGELLIVSDDATLSTDFMGYLRAQNGLSVTVLHPTPFNSWDAAQAYADQHPNNVWAIVELPSSVLTATTKGEFTIGMNFTATPWTFQQTTRSLFSRPSAAGADGYALYVASGFLTLQSLVQNFLLDKTVASGVAVAGPATLTNTDPALGIRTYLNNHGQATIPMPIPPTFNNRFMTQWQYYVPLVVMMAAIFPVARLTALIVEEKPMGIRESMLIMGMHRTCMFGGWYLSSLLTDFIAALLASMILKFGFLHYTSYGILLVLYFTFLQHNTALALFLSTLFSNPRLASWCAAFLIFIFAIPAYNFPDGMSAIAKMFLSLLPCIGFTLSFFDLTEYSSFGRRFTWDVAREGSFNLAIAVGMMWAGWGLFMIFAFYLDRVWPGTVGRPEPWYFPIRPIIRCFRARRQLKPVPMAQPRSSLRRDMYTGYTAAQLQKLQRAAHEPASELCAEVADEIAAGQSMPQSRPSKLRSGSGEEAVCPWDASAMMEHRADVVLPCDPSIAAVFDSVYKVYYGGGLVGWFYTYFTGLFRRGDRTVALDGVTFAMRKGEVSVLLGPNGAGKSTIMGVATGMVRPTSGEVYIGGYAASDDLDKCRQHIGYCPQMDIVWGNLTVAEHLAFYARLKGCDSIDVRAHVEKALSLVGLEEKRDFKAANLSGGQRRRLCVGIALVADSTVLLLDEPTAGMDIMGRKIVYDALNRARANRSVLLCTHLLDEADRIGDRILIVNDGRLCGEGSSMYLKSQMRVGYVVTCVMEGDLKPDEEDNAVNELIEFVKVNGYKKHAADQREVVAVPATCQLVGVERRGREVSFRFPLSLLSNGGQELLTALQSHTEELRVRAIGLNLTSLEDVFMTATTGGPMSTASAMEACDERIAEMRAGVAMGAMAMDTCHHASYEDSGVLVVFLRHFRAMFIKRMKSARRDLVLLIFQVFIPVMFLLLSLLINLIRAPEQPSLLLDMTMFPEYTTHPGQVLLSHANSDLDKNAFQIDSSTPGSALGVGYVADFRMTPFDATERNATLYLSQELARESASHPMTRYFAIATSGMLNQSGPMQNNAAIMHNISYAHSVVMGLGAAYNLARHQVFGDAVPQISVRNRPMPLGEFEKEMWDANKQVMSGIFVILPFILIPCNTISYIMREKETGARHMQWLSGGSVAAYWLSSFVFDFACYVGTTLLAMLIFLIFDRKEYVLPENAGAVVTLFMFFGLASVSSAYLMSFFFNSAFTAQTVVLLVNFVFGFLWVTLEEMLAIGAYKFVYYFTAIIRLIPAVSFGEGMYVISGRRIGAMMFPNSPRTSMFSLVELTDTPRFVGGIGTSLAYMGCVTVGCVVALVVLEYLRVQRLCRGLGSCCAEDASDAAAALAEDRDPSVVAEEARVCEERTGPAGDMIAVQHLRKHYFGASEPAVADVSLGVREGEVMGLLGLNGAGKSTMMGVIAGEMVPTSGYAYVNHVPVMSPKSRSFIGYCPQYDPLLDLLSPKEHLWLYARLRGMREELIRGEVDNLIRELGLYPHRHQAARMLSGGNKRRLTLALALVGRTTSILLDEPTAGMDTLARSQTCAMVKRLTASKSVILTTHLLDEVEAMADRVTFVTRGHVSCIGTPAELRSRANHDAAYTVTVTFHHDVDLTSGHADVPARVERYVSEVIQQGRAAVSASDSQEGQGEEARGAVAPADCSPDRWCEVSEVHVASMRVRVSAPLADICGAMSGLREGAAPGVPPVDFVSVSQPTLEDILLETEKPQD